MISILIFALQTLVSPSIAMDRAALEQLFNSHPQVTTLDQVPEMLPAQFRMNFVLKYGGQKAGERGHLPDPFFKMSADPLAPRVLIFDQQTGFTVAYNGGKPGQAAGELLDVLNWDPVTKTFDLTKIDFPLRGHVQFAKEDCTSCHGPNQRPIFSMYPDWPGFYGSDNDELTRGTPLQSSELANFRKFRSLKEPRYSPLFATAPYPTWPLRQDVSEVPTAVSRSFAFRPALRAGIVYNRLNAQFLEKKIFTHPRFAKFGAYFLSNLFECQPHDLAKRDQWLARVQSALGKPAVLAAGRLEYRQMWSLFDLGLNDVDIRYSYHHQGYANTNAKGKIMQIGYIDSYVNSYFDGSATVDELVSAAVFEKLVATYPRLKGLAIPRGLEEKYKHFAARYANDRNFFQSADILGKWLAIPYAHDVAAEQHRERFTQELVDQHVRLCQALEAGL